MSGTSGPGHPDGSAHPQVRRGERGGSRAVWRPRIGPLGDDLLCHIDPRDREAARLAYAAMADRAIDGYQVQRRIVTPEGAVVGVDVWGRRVEAGGQLYGMWVLVPASEPAIGVETLVVGVSDVVLAVTDHDWLIEYMNADAQILGVTGSELRGFPLLGLVHPSAASEFLAAARRAAVDHIGVTVFTRMRVGQEGWAERHCFLVPICEHQPPRLGVVISPGTLPTAESFSGGQLDEQLRQAALEARANRALSAYQRSHTCPRAASSQFAKPRSWLGLLLVRVHLTSRGRSFSAPTPCEITWSPSTANLASTPRLNFWLRSCELP